MQTRFDLWIESSRHKIGGVLSLPLILNILPIRDILKNKRYKANIEQ